MRCYSLGGEMYGQNHLLLTLIGDAWAGTEEWSIGLRIGPPDANPDAPLDWPLQDWVTAYASPTSSMHSNIELSHPAHVRLLRLKLAAIDGDTGKYFGSSDSVEHVYATPVAGAVGGAHSAATSYVIPQSSIAVTLTTSISRGYASKGRFFMPPSVLPLEPDGQLLTQNSTNIANTIKTWINALNAVNGPGNVKIYSKGRGTKTVDANGKVRWTYPVDGNHAEVTGIRVGRVVDTQRRRRRELLEEPTAVSLA
jgi:hypothetical protein